MSNLTSNLTQWGSSGSIYPDGYNYLEGEQPVDAWDNYFNYHTIEEIHSLQNVVNARIEADSGSARPTSPETPHIFYDTDTGVFEIYDGTSWHPLLYGDGDALTGDLDLNGNTIKDSTAGPVTLSGTVSVPNGNVKIGNLSDLVGTTYSDTGSHRNNITGRRARGSSSTPSAVASGDILFRTQVAGYDGGKFLNAALINYEVADTVSSGVIPSRIKLATGNSNGSLLDALVIGPSGNVVLQRGSLEVDQGTIHHQRGDPTTSELDAGENMTYNSDGTGTGAAGDLVYAVNDAGTVKTTVLAAKANAT